MKKIAMASIMVLTTQVFATELPTKDGFFVGVDWSLGQGVGSAEGKFGLAINNSPVGNGDDVGVFENGTLTNSAKLVLGYQR